MQSRNDLLQLLGHTVRKSPILTNEANTIKGKEKEMALKNEVKVVSEAILKKKSVYKKSPPSPAFIPAIPINQKRSEATKRPMDASGAAVIETIKKSDYRRELPKAILNKRVIYSNAPSAEINRDKNIRDAKDVNISGISKEERMASDIILDTPGEIVQENKMKDLSIGSQDYNYPTVYLTEEQMPEIGFLETGSIFNLEVECELIEKRERTEMNGDTKCTYEIKLKMAKIDEVI